MTTYKGRVGIVQRVLPRYRAPFFDLLAKQCNGLGVFAGAARPSEYIPVAERLEIAEWTHAENQHLLAGPFYLCAQRGLTEWLDEWEPDVLIVEANPRYVTTPAAVEMIKNRFRPVIGWGLGSPKPRGPLASLQMHWRKRFLRQFDALIAYSQRGAAEYHNLGFSSNRVFVAPNAVVPRSAGKPPIQEKTGDKLTVLYVGRLQKRKHVDSLIKACATLPNAIQPKLQIVGDGQIKKGLQRLSRDIYPKTEFVGAQFGKELDRRFDQADLFVLPGSGGLAVQQAMAHGLPIIAAEGDGSQEDLVQPGNGWLVKPNDDKALQHTLAQALSDPERLRKMGEESFQRVQKDFNLENMVEAFVKAINEVTG